VLPIALGPLATMIAALVAGPVLLGISWPRPGEWVGIIVGYLAGLALGSLTRARVQT
jgi:hypothetical protein